MSYEIQKIVSSFVKRQFPAFYEKEGSNFVMFLEAYYEWLEQYYAVIETSTTSTFNSGDIVTGATSGASGQIINIIDSKTIYLKISTPGFITGETISSDSNSNSIKTISTSAGVILEARNLFEYKDIDTTTSNSLEDFLVHFQEKYLYGIPYSIISNKRFLLKHIQDIYRTKGTIRCYNLLFKLIYDQEVEIYTPAYDILKTSDGTWEQPKYIEVTKTSALKNIVGKQIIGSKSETVAIVERYIEEPINNNITCTLYISNIIPRGATFEIGERLLNYKDRNLYSLYEAPQIIGSLDSIKIVSGGDGFNVGDILAIAEKDINNNQQISYGQGGKLRIVNTDRSQGTLQFFIEERGFGITANAELFFYKSPGDNAGYGASFNLGPLSFLKNITYNTDLIVDYKDTTLNSAVFNLPLNYSANVIYALNQSLSFTNNYFGSLYSLTNINPGNNYIYPPDIFVRSTLSSINALAGTIKYSNADIFVLTPGTLTYNTASNTITGNNTNFLTKFVNNDVIGLQSANTPGIEEYHLIYSVDSDTQLTLATVPTNNSSPYSKYYKVASIFGTGTQFADYFANGDPIGIQADGANTDSFEIQMIKQVVNNSLILLYGPTKYNSTGTAKYYIEPSILTAQLALYEPVMYQVDGTIPGLNSKVGALPNIGNNIVSEAIAYDSGKGYIEGETIKAYAFNVLTTPEIVDGGGGYQDFDQLIFSGGTLSTSANGFVTTGPNGSIVGVTLVNPGAGYTSIPYISVQSANGTGAVLTTTIAAPNNYNTYSVVVGQVKKASIGTAPGQWTSTRGFLNSNKYIQDSSYYQDYSYEIRVANTLDKYKQIIYNTFHSAGMELFGSYLGIDAYDATSSVLFEVSKPIYEQFMSVDCEYDPLVIPAVTSVTTCDANTSAWTSDLYWYPIRADYDGTIKGHIESDNEFLTCDATYLYY